MKKFRILLYPFSLIYGLMAGVRNLLFDTGILRSYNIPLKSITVGNLSVGGTGKSPMVDLLVGLLTQKGFKVATLSRGYGRTSKGLIVADSSSDAAKIGDEPLLYHSHYGDRIHVLVAEERINGVQYIEQKLPDTDVVILDDAFQHRKVKAGVNIIVSEFDNPFYKDHLLPAGNLRESRSGIKRADLVLITKCPDKLCEEEVSRIKNAIDIANENIFFSRIAYKKLVSMNDIQPFNAERILLVTGIGNPKPLISHLRKQFKVDHLPYRDHHVFTEDDILEIHKKFNNFAGNYRCVITTEKDFMRLRNEEAIMRSDVPWFYQSIEMEIIDYNLFEGKILKYVEQN